MDTIQLAALIREVVRQELAIAADDNIVYPDGGNIETGEVLDWRPYLADQPRVWEDPGDGNRQFWRSRRGRIMLRTQDQNGPTSDGSGGLFEPFDVEYTRDGITWQTKHVPPKTVYVILPADTKAIRVADGAVSDEIEVPWDVQMIATGRDPR